MRAPDPPVQIGAIAAHWPHLQATVLRHASFQIVASKVTILTFEQAFQLR